MNEQEFKFPIAPDKTHNFFVGHCHQCKKSFWGTDYSIWCGHPLTKKSKQEISSVEGVTQND